jgi:hypothetical protein
VVAEVIMLIWFAVYHRKKLPAEMTLETYRNEGAKSWFKSESIDNSYRNVSKAAKKLLKKSRIKDIEELSDHFVSWCASKGIRSVEYF